MKKIISILVLSLLIISVIWFCFQLYLNHNSSSNSNSNNYLGNINYVVQIGYNLCYLIIAIVVLYVAYDQLSKTREATNIQALNSVFNNFKSDEFYKKRKRLAHFIINEGKDNCGVYHLRVKLSNYEDLENYDEKTQKEISNIKNHFEDVIYEFVPISYFFRKKKIYRIEDIYFLFSYEIQRYWITVKHLGYIEFVRKNRVSGEHDFYKGLESLFYETLIQEVKEGDGYASIPFIEKIIYSRLFRLDSKFGIEGKKITALITDIEKRKSNSIDLFLLEESLLLENTKA